MVRAFTSVVGLPPRHLLAVGTGFSGRVPPGTECHVAAHPVPDHRSVEAARRALAVAAESSGRDLLVVLLSGGASALLALPAHPLQLCDKAAAVRVLLKRGADIQSLNTVRKHLSAIKGGRLAIAASGPVLTLAVSDVVGDDLSQIGSGPTVGDPTTFSMALDVLDRHGGRDRYPVPVVDYLGNGAAGGYPESPTADVPSLATAAAFVIGNRLTAAEGACAAASALGYHVVNWARPVTGAARSAARDFIESVAADCGLQPRPLCIVGSGETTVDVRGRGLGGRNQEFALALVDGLPLLGACVAATSVGTDGIDGPTDAAGAIVDSTTHARAEGAGVGDVERFFRDNDSYHFFERLDDLIHLGPSDTNVGDLQIILAA